MWCRVSLLVSLVCLTLGQEYLLPGDVVPKHYDVKFLFDLDPTTKFSYYGLVDILLEAMRPTSRIVLHAQEYEIDKENIKLIGDQGSVRVTKVNLNDTYNFLTLDLDGTLEQNKNYTLTIPFSGLLKNALNGVYISNYVDKKTKTKEDQCDQTRVGDQLYNDAVACGDKKNTGSVLLQAARDNRKRYLIATQFEAIYARKGFPCFDEPKYKASFHITIGHNREFNAVSNMPLRRTYRDDNEFDRYWPWNNVGLVFKKDKSNFVWDEFENSVPMSTYLVAFVVSKFAFVESPAELSRAKFRIWARKDAISQTEYASVIGPKVLSHFEKWFNVSFPLPKQDMMAIPDFSAGAMENWGLITYRETALLYDKEESSFLNKERVAEVIAHELAHQWFGNLVTMKWWSDLWLNEGFATFVASIGVAAVEPSWGARQSYAIDDMMSVLNLDSLESSHPVRVPIDNPKRISEIFDEISYRKGSTLIRMMTMFLGEDIFQKAINRYLIKYSYQNAEQDDLWQVLTDVNQQYGGLARNVTVKEIMDTWTTQTGYPLLTVNRDYSENSLTVTQKRYFALGAKAKTSVSWWVPLNVLCENEVGTQANEPVQWLEANEGTVNEHKFEHGANTDEWLLFNKDYIAPYRVNYDQRNWDLLINTLTSDKFANIPEMSRVQLLGDAFALAWSNQLDYTTALQLANYLQRETEFLPIDAGLRELGKIENVLKRSSDYGAYQKFVRKLITERYLKSGGLAAKRIMNGEDLNSVKMQVTTSSWACRMKVPGCEENAIEMFQQWMNTENPDENNPIPLDLRRTVYCVAISRGSVAEWRFLLARQQRSNVAAAHQAYQQALACTREVWILAQYLEWTVSGTGEIRSQDSATVIATVARSSVGYYVAKDFLYTRVQDIFNVFKSEGGRMGRIIKSVLSQFTTQRELDEFETWRERNGKYLEDSKIAIEQAIEKAKVNIDWLNKNGKHVVEKIREFST